MWNFQDVVKRFWEIAGAVSIQTKIFGIVLGSTILLSLGFALQTRIAMRGVLMQKSQEQGVSIAHDLAARSTDLILINDLYALHQLLEEAENSFSDIRYAFVMDSDGYVLAHTFGGGIPADLTEINPDASDAHHNLLEIRTEEGLIWDVAVPIFDGKAGTARVGISSQSMNITLTRLTTQLGLTVILVLGISLLAATLLTWILTRPILELVKATRAVGKGDFSVQVGRWADDEIGDLAGAFNQMTSELGRLDIVRQEREMLRKQLLEGVITAQEEERRRIARELHDSTSQSLTSLMIGLRNVSDTCSVPEVDQQIRQLRDEVNNTLEDVHALAVQLRPAILDDLGLRAAVERLVVEWGNRYHVSADVFVHLGDIRLPEYIETALYRIIQEALTNIAKHAHADSVSVLIDRRMDDVVAIIEDDGLGFEIENKYDGGHLGLMGMKERAELLEGKLEIESLPGEGTSVYASIPIVSMNEISDER